MVGDDRAQQLIAALMRALGHRMRTPLSVIANELAVYKSLLPNEDVGRLIERCRAISDLLTSVTVPRAGSLVRLELGEVLRSVGATVQGDMVVVADDVRVSWLLRTMKRLFADSDGTWSVQLRSAPGGGEVVFSLQHPAVVGLAPEGGCAEFSALFNERCDLDLVEPPVIDALLQALGWRSVIQLHPDPLVRIAVPGGGAHGA